MRPTARQTFGRVHLSSAGRRGFAGNFALKPDSEIFKDFPGFPLIPFGEIGPQASRGHGAAGAAELGGMGRGEG